MIRSLIGIACILVSMTTCVEDIAAAILHPQPLSSQTWQGSQICICAQPASSEPISDLRSDRPLPRLRNWLQISDRRFQQRFESMDLIDNDFRFRASPVKQRHDWPMPIVDVRPAKSIQAASPTGTTPSNRTVINDEHKRNSVLAGFHDLILNLRDNSNSWVEPAFHQILQVNLAAENFGRAIVSELCGRFSNLRNLTSTEALQSSPGARRSANSFAEDDYWDYYAHCDRWNVVFAKPTSTPPTAEAVYELSRVKKSRDLRRFLRTSMNLDGDLWDSAVNGIGKISEGLTIRFR